MLFQFVEDFGHLLIQTAAVRVLVRISSKDNIYKSRTEFQTQLKPFRLFPLLNNLELHIMLILFIFRVLMQIGWCVWVPWPVYTYNQWLSVRRLDDDDDDVSRTLQKCPWLTQRQRGAEVLCYCCQHELFLLKSCFFHKRCCASRPNNSTLVWLFQTMFQTGLAIVPEILLAQICEPQSHFHFYFETKMLSPGKLSKQIILVQSPSVLSCHGF